MTSERPTGHDLVIVADADPLVRWSLAHYLGRWFEVHTAATLVDARRLLHDAQPPAAVIVGDEFPDGLGTELTAEAAAAHPDVRIIQITASTEFNGAADRASVVEKPFALAEIAAMIGVHTPTK